VRKCPIIKNRCLELNVYGASDTRILRDAFVIVIRFVKEGVNFRALEVDFVSAEGILEFAFYN
jgi:hypothetical protein